MMSRRLFTACALCAAAAGFAATPASAQQPPVSQTPGLKRRILSQTEGPAPGYVTLVAEVEIPPGALAARHTHPGIETSYVLEGIFDLPVEGRPTVTLRPGDAFQIPAGTPHAGGPPSPGLIRLVSTFVVLKDQPFATPA